MKSIIIIVLFLSSNNFIFGQISPEWVSTYGGNPIINYSVNEMVTDKNGNSYVFGYECDTAYNLKGIIIKYNSDGIQQWLNTYDGIGTYGRIKIDKNGNVYLLSRILGFSFSYDYLTIKYDSNGNLKWTAVFNGTADFTDQPYAIAIDDSLNVYVTGQATGIGTDGDFATVKYDSTGTQKWVATYNHGYNDRAYAIAVDSLSNVYVTGSSFDTINGSLLTIKYNSIGSQVWIKRFLGKVSAIGLFIEISKNGFIYVGGSDGEPGYSDYLCIKYNSLGDTIWTAKYNAQETLLWNGWDTPRAMKLDKFGNVYFTGTQFNGNGAFDDYCTVKFNESGIFQWAKSYYGGTSMDDAFSLDVDNQENVYVLGRSNDSIYNHLVLTTIIYDINGNVSWLNKFFTLNEAYGAISICLDSLSNIYISAYCNSITPHFVTLKYSNYFGITELNNSLSFNIYPNPVTSSLNVDFSDVKGILLLSIFNINGQVLIKKQIKENRTIIDVSNLTSGIYFVKIISDNAVEIIKLIKE